MKQFLVSMSLILLICSCLLYQTRENNKLLFYTEMKNLAEECAEAGALSADENFNVHIKTDEALNRAYEFLSLECETLGLEDSDFKLEQLSVPTSNDGIYSSCYAIKLTQISTGFSRSSVYEWVLK